MWALDYKESWEPKNWCFLTVVLEKTLESPLDWKEFQPVHPKGNWSWIFIGRTDVEAETPILRPPDARSWLIGKDPDAGIDWRQKKKRVTKDEIESITDSMNSNLSKLWETEKGKPGVLQAMESQRVKHNLVTEQQKRLDTFPVFIFYLNVLF